MSALLFVLGILALGATLLGLTNPRRPVYLVPITFMVGWLAADLAVVNLVTHVLVTALLVWAGALGSGWGVAGLVAMALSWVGLVILAIRHRAAAPALDAALDELLGADPDRPSVSLPPAWLFSPVVLRRPGVEVIRNVRYGEFRRNRLDVHRPADHRTGCPVLLQVHGGAWVIGNSHQQGQPLMRHMVAEGWVCVAINYRLSPQATFPDHIVDVKRSIAWVREHIHEYGGDPDTIIITGGSAGGHLAALAALTPNEPRFQPGFEDVDTSVTACIPFYGVYDLCDRKGRRQGAYERLLSKVVFKTRLDDDRDNWEAACPVTWVSSTAPPFFVIQGADDTLVYAEEARDFVEALSEVSKEPVVYAEIPYAQHAFDVLVTPRSLMAARAVGHVARWAHERRMTAGG
jgi:acetyl esterase/lipase